MLDTQGPEIRTGSWSGKGEEEFVIGQKVTLTTEKEFVSKQERASERSKGALVWISYEKLLDTVHPGSCILLDDGAIELKVDSLDVLGKSIECTVLNTGSLGNKKGNDSRNIKLLKEFMLLTILRSKYAWPFS